MIWFIWARSGNIWATTGCALWCAAMIWLSLASSCSSLAMLPSARMLSAIVQDLLEEGGEEGGNDRLCSLVCGNDLAQLGKLPLQSGNVALRPDVVGNQSLLPEKILSL